MTDDTETDTDGDERQSRADAASPASVDRLARQYAEQGRPFARVTVVRREPPVSANVGDRAIVTPDGELVGWIGGVACAQSVAVREAQAALRRGEPTLVGIAPDPETVDRPGLAAFPMTCHSQGTLELFVEPVVPVPRLVVVGDSPIARAVTRLAGDLSYDVTAVTPDGTAVDGADQTLELVDDVEAVAESLHGATWVVAASMGASDDVAVAAALRSGVPYVGLVASGRRADKLAARVADRTGHAPDEVRAAIHSPAGLDIGAKTPEEVGISILAELVSVRRTDDFAVDLTRVAVDRDAVDTTQDPDETADEGATALDDAEDAVVTDPVCGMDVTVGEAAAIATHDGTTYHFCGVGCRDAFVDDPGRFLERAEP